MAKVLGYHSGPQGQHGSPVTITGISAAKRLILQAASGVPVPTGAITLSDVATRTNTLLVAGRCCDRSA